MQKYETDALTDRLIDFLERRPKDQPFFAILSVQPPHDPFMAPPEYMSHFDPNAVILRPNVPMNEEACKKYRRDLAGYYAQIENLDFNVGRVMNALKSMNLLDSTNLAFFSDHGIVMAHMGMSEKVVHGKKPFVSRASFVQQGEKAKSVFLMPPLIMLILLLLR